MTKLTPEVITTIQKWGALTLSEGTMIPQDLISSVLPILTAGADDLQEILHDQRLDAVERWAEVFEIAERAVDEALPDYWLGAHPGDGACLGIWPNELLD